MDTNHYLKSPEEFLNQLGTLPPGWAEEEGGLLKVVERLGTLQDELNQQSRMIAAVRAAAVAELLKTTSGADIARQLGMNRANISRLSKAERWNNPTW